MIIVRQEARKRGNEQASRIRDKDREDVPKRRKDHWHTAWDWLHMLEDSKTLKSKVKDAVAVLEANQGKASNKM